MSSKKHETTFVPVVEEAVDEVVGVPMEGTVRQYDVHFLVSVPMTDRLTSATLSKIVETAMLRNDITPVASNVSEVNGELALSVFVGEEVGFDAGA